MPTALSPNTTNQKYNAKASTPAKALCVDLDGTLCKTDTLLESWVEFAKQKILLFWLPLLWLIKGRLHIKMKLASETNLDVQSLPYSQSVLQLIELAKHEGRKIVLVSASPQKIVDQVAKHLKLFDEAHGSTHENLKASRKAEFLREKFGAGNFDYVGDSRADLKVWAECQTAYIVESSKSLAKSIRGSHNIKILAPTSKRSWVTSFLKSLRIHQWVKNILILVPITTAHELSERTLLFQSLLAILSFSLSASAVYVLNDLADLSSDRKHSHKRNRPFASGDLSVLVGLLTIPVLLCSSIAVALFLPKNFMFVLMAYIFVTTIYSLWLKKMEIWDVLVLAGLYTLRMIAGGAATAVPISEWLLAYSMFFFLSLAFLKRHGEVISMIKNSSDETKISRRGYLTSDLEIIRSVGICCGALSVLVFALYIHSDAVKTLYQYPQVLWGICPFLLYWIIRAWLLSERNLVHSDTIVFALKDKTTYFIGITVLLLLLLAKGIF